MARKPWPRKGRCGPDPKLSDEQLARLKARLELGPAVSLANLAVHTATGHAVAVKNRLKRMQYRTRLIDGYLTGTGQSPPTPARP